MIPAAEEVKSYAVRLTYATHPDHIDDKQEYRAYIRHGASPRGAQSLILGGKVFALLEGRVHLTLEDIRRAAKPSLRHRILLSFEGEAEGVRTDQIIDTLIDRVPERV